MLVPFLCSFQAILFTQSPMNKLSHIIVAPFESTCYTHSQQVSQFHFLCHTFYKEAIHSSYLFGIWSSWFSELVHGHCISRSQCILSDPFSLATSCLSLWSLSHINHTLLSFSSCLFCPSCFLDTFECFPFSVDIFLTVASKGSPYCLMYQPRLFILLTIQILHPTRPLPPSFLGTYSLLILLIRYSSLLTVILKLVLSPSNYTSIISH